jgi:hypothetical protein
VSEQGGDNRGQMVEHFLRSVHLPPGQPWCAALVYHVGPSVLYDHLALGDAFLEADGYKFIRWAEWSRKAVAA